MTAFLQNTTADCYLTAVKNIVLNTIDTIKGDSIPSIFAHSWDGLGKASGSKYWSANSKVTDYKSALLNDGNFVNIAMDRGILNAKQVWLMKHDNGSYKDSVRAPFLIQNNPLNDLTDAPVTSLDFALQKFSRYSKISTSMRNFFDLKDMRFLHHYTKEILYFSRVYYYPMQRIPGVTEAINPVPG